jgi:hypothetical protein
MRLRAHRWLGPLVALALAAGGLVSVSPAGAAEVGINVAATSGDFFNSAQVDAAIRASHPAWVRVFIGWDGIEPQQGVYNTAEIQNYQRFFAALPAGTKIDVDVEGTPPWAAAGSTDIRTPPVDAADYGAFMNYLVNAFGGRVNAWEIWNEEDSSAWWNGTPAQYVELLKAAYPAVKSADPKATVIVGGLTGNDGPYLSELYADGAQGSFDAVGVHTDTGCNVTAPTVFEYNLGTHTVNQYFFLGFTSIHAVMVAAGDGSKPVYMTELGWSSTSAECQTGHWAGQKLAGVTEPTQAAYLQQAYHCLAQPEYSYVKAAMWFELFNNGGTSAPLDNFGLLNQDLSPKPAFDAFTQESLHGDQLSGPCGNVAPPAIKVLRSLSGQHFSGPLQIAVSASSPANGVREITIRLARHSRVHFVSKGFPATFSGVIAWQAAKMLKPGPHKIKIIVTNRLGNVAIRTVRVVHVRVAPWHRRRHTASSSGRLRHASLARAAPRGGRARCLVWWARATKTATLFSFRSTVGGCPGHPGRALSSPTAGAGRVAAARSRRRTAAG